MSMEIRGTILTSRKAFVEENFGKEGWEKVLKSLSDEDQDFFKNMLISSGWYPFDIAERLDQAIVDVLGGGKNEVFKEIGAKSARKNLSESHQIFLKPDDPQAFMAQANTIYSFYYKVGYREYEPTGEKSGIMTTYDADAFSVPDCLTIIGWYEEALKMCGAKEVNIVEEKCRAKGDKYCRYNISWKM
ncbi:MAG: heme NO-binding domain-containing protein [bacterium]